MPQDHQAEQSIQTTQQPHHSIDPFYIIDHFFSKQYTLDKHHYHRSKVFTPTPGRNPMLAASHPIFSMIHRLKQNIDMGSPPVTDAIRWQHELRAFVDSLSMAGYSREMMGCACFALMMVIDETSQVVGQSSSLPALLLPEHLQEVKTGPLFFNLIDACYRDENKYLDLLELLYYCLENGYTGVYAKKHQGLFELSQLRDQMLKTLKKHHHYTEPWLVEPPATPNKGRIKPRLLIGLAFTLLLFAGQLAYLKWSHIMPWHHHTPASITS